MRIALRWSGGGLSLPRSSMCLEHAGSTHCTMAYHIRCPCPVRCLLFVLHCTGLRVTRLFLQGAGGLSRRLSSWGVGGG